MSDAPGRYIVDPDRGYREFAIWEIYTGPDGTGVYVPNVNDAVRDWKVGWYRVKSVDYTTGLSQLELWETPSTNTDVDQSELLLGVGPGYQSETWRVYVDTRKIPYTLEIDRRLHLYGTEVTHLKLFKGVDVSETGQVISAHYDQAGNLLGENIPLQLVATTDRTNTAIKCPTSSFTSVPLVDGEVVSYVAYAANGTPVSKGKLLVENTSLARRSESNLRYITGIRLESPFLSASDPQVIEFPINLNVDSITLQGVVEYSNGDIVKLPITGDVSDKFSLFGLRHYVPTIEGQPVPLTLNYRLSDTEYSYVQGPTANGSIAEAYRGITVRADNSYSVKLFAYPNWKGEVNGYELDFWLYSLDRDQYYRVPKGLVELHQNSPAFDGLNYISTQKIAFAINLKDVDPSYNSYRHVQTLAIHLKTRGTLDQTNWTVAFDPNSTEVFGDNLKAAVTFINTNNWRVNIGNGFPTVETWLRALYYGVKPLYDTQTEAEAPLPNMFAITTARRRTEFMLDQWNQELPIYYDLNEGETLFVEWIYRTPVTDLYLGVTGLSCHQIN